MPQIQNLQTVHRLTVMAFIARELGKLRAAGYPVPSNPSEVADLAVGARVDHGRWLADCPYCPGAELVDLEDLRFFCLSCYNEAAGGRWLHIVMPEAQQREAIEAYLQQWPQLQQHWDSSVQLRSDA